MDRFLKVERMKNYVYFQPLYFLHKDVGEGLLKEQGIPLWEGYKFGLQRTACRCCPGQKPEAFAAIRSQFPEVWMEMKAMEARMGTGYWQDSDEAKRSTCEIMADRGEAKFLEGEYPIRLVR